MLPPSPAHLPPGVSGFAYDVPSIVPRGVVQAASEHPARTRGTSWKLRDTGNSLLLFRDQTRCEAPREPWGGGVTAIDPHCGAVWEQRMGEIYGSCSTVLCGDRGHPLWRPCCQEA